MFIRFVDIGGMLTINVSFHNILEKYIHKSYTYGISLVSDP